MKMARKQVTDFSRENLGKLIQGSIDSFKKLRPGDLMSLYQFVCMLACQEKSEIFVTYCPLLIVNRENIEKNTGVEIKTPREVARDITKQEQ